MGYMEHLNTLKLQNNPVVLPKPSEEELKQDKLDTKLKYDTFLRCLFFGVWMSEETLQFVSVHSEENEFTLLNGPLILEMSMYTPNPFLETEAGRLQAERLEKKI
jgi:hypothetical protein